jgi:predicted ABC-type ATPase
MLSLEKPRLWIVAGPNGSGKSTLYDRTDIRDFGRSVWIINPDILTAHIAKQERLPLLIAIGETLDRIQAWLRISIRTYKTVGVETVLSTNKYRRLVRSAKAHGFEIRFHGEWIATGTLAEFGRLPTHSGDDHASCS